MAITSFDGFIGSTKQHITITKVGGTRSTDYWTTLFDIAGAPGAGTLAAGNTANGVVPTSATAGMPAITAFAGGATGYLAAVNAGTYTATSRFKLFDCLFRCGAYAFNANTTLTAQPSYSARLPGTSYVDLQIWFEGVTVFTGAPVVTVTYTNQAGTTGRTTGAITLASTFKAGRMQQLPLQAGDTGVQKIESVTCGTATVGTFNVLVLRPLWTAKCQQAFSNQQVHDLTRTGMPVVYADSALYVICNPFTAGTPDAEVSVVIASA